MDEGYYVATNLSTGLQVGYDHFAIRNAGDGLVIESQHTMFGPLNAVQSANFTLDHDWTPRRLEVRVAAQDYHAVVEFADAVTLMSIHSPNGDQQLRFPIGRQRAYFFLNGAIYFPLHIVRRFHFDNPAPQRFEVIPDGLCEVWRLPDVVEEQQTFRLLEMKVLVSGHEDMLRLVVNQGGDLVRYRTRNLNLLVKLEEGQPRC